LTLFGRSAPTEPISEFALGRGGRSLNSNSSLSSKRTRRVGFCACPNGGSSSTTCSSSSKTWTTSRSTEA